MKRKTARETIKNKRLHGIALLGALLLLATALAGCTSTQATATQLQTRADDHAADWDSDAELILITGAEGTIQMQSMMGAWGLDALDSPAFDDATEQAFWDRVRDDPEPGNGKTEFWMYVYRDSSGQNHLIVVIDRDQEVIYTEETDENIDMGVPIGTYNVDSDQAMRIALETNGFLADAKESDHFGFMMGLMRETAQDNPIWVVGGGGGGQSGGGGGVVIIDATSGTILHNDGGSGGMDGFGS